MNDKATFLVVTSLLALCAQPALCKLTRLHDQNSKHLDTGTGIVSQNFTSNSSAYTSSGADDFVVPTGHTWKIKKVITTGQYANGSGPASSENVLFYTDKNFLPDKVVKECDNLQGTDNQGSFTIVIPKSCKVTLPAGHYWLSVVANVDSNCCGVWEWNVRGDFQKGDEAAWENPGNGYGTGCTVWTTMQYCFTVQGTDLMWALYGIDQ